jgi:hypothetical protein
MRSLRSTVWYECSSQADESTSGQSKRTSAGLIESDLARAFTHTLTSSCFEMVDRQRATSILAAGYAHVAASGWI